MMFLITYHRRSAHTIIIEAPDQETARRQYLDNPYYRRCDDCGASLLEDDTIIDVSPCT